MIKEFQWLSFETTTPQHHAELAGERFEVITDHVYGARELANYQARVRARHDTFNGRRS
jgi:hypothetical protein